MIIEVVFDLQAETDIASSKDAKPRQNILHVEERMPQDLYALVHNYAPIYSVYQSDRQLLMGLALEKKKIKLLSY